MARIRSVHPGLLTDEAFAQLTVECPIAGLLMIGLWMQADDSGAFEWKPLTIKMSCLPAAPARVEDLLEVLLGVNVIRRFEIGGRSFGVIRNFVRWQRVKRPKDVHPFTAESRAYAGFVGGKRPRAETGRPGVDEADMFEPDGEACSDMGVPSSDIGVPSSDNVGPSSDIGVPSSAIRRQMAELGALRKEEGGRRFEESNSVVVVPITTLAKTAPRTDDDDLIERISGVLDGKAAAGVAARLARLTRPLLAEGASLEADVLAELREIRAKASGELRAGAVGWIVEQIRDRRDGRLAAQKARAGPAPPARVFVARDTPAWRAWVAAGHKPGLVTRGTRDGRAVEGWSFESEWPPPAAGEAASGAA
jgi:hypothetical protein